MPGHETVIDVHLAPMGRLPVFRHVGSGVSFITVPLGSTATPVPPPPAPVELVLPGPVELELVAMPEAVDAVEPPVPLVPVCSEPQARTSARSVNAAICVMPVLI